MLTQIGVALAVISNSEQYDIYWENGIKWIYPFTASIGLV